MRASRPPSRRPTRSAASPTPPPRSPTAIEDLSARSPSGSAGSSTRSPASPSRPTCWRSTPPSRPPAPASRAAASPSSPRRSASWPRSPRTPPARSPALIGEIQAETQKVVGVVAEGAKRTEDGVATVEQAREAFEQIGDAVERRRHRASSRSPPPSQQISAEAERAQTGIGEVAAVAEESSAVGRAGLRLARSRPAPPRRRSPPPPRSWRAPPSSSSSSSRASA